MSFECICYVNILKMDWIRKNYLMLTKRLFGLMLLFVRKFHLMPPISFASFLFIVLNNYLFFYISDGSGRHHCLWKNIHFPKQILFASLLVIVLINSNFLLLVTVQADATVYAKNSISSHQLHLPPLKVLFYLIIIFILKTSTLITLLNCN